MNLNLEINKQTINNFKNEVLTKLGSLDKITDSSYLKTMLTELNKLFTILSGVYLSESDIPTENDFPDSSKFNEILSKLDIDISKIYNAQKIVETDALNLFNYNSSEREHNIINITNTQRLVFEVELKTNSSSGSVIFTESFTTNNLNKECDGVQVDDRKQALTLANDGNKEIYKTNIAKDGVNCMFSTPIDSNYNTYIKNVSGKKTGDLYIGSRYVTPHTEVHSKFFDDITLSKSAYLSRLVDSHIISNISSVQFEAIITQPKWNNKTPREHLENYISEYKNCGIENIYVNNYDSVHSTTTSSVQFTNTTELKYNTVILDIPFINSSTINSFTIQFESNEGGLIPTIDISQSYVINKEELKVPFIQTATFGNIGGTTLLFAESIIPTNIHLYLNYPVGNSWQLMNNIKHSIWKYSMDSSNIVIDMKDYTGSSSVTSSMIRDVYVVVPTSRHPDTERSAVNNVLKYDGVRGGK